ncbi:hypothetical protein KSS87_006155 [Heliosperma pusillum]|nr:hypothetical protein KSS87_006155 [Heliosperma pusillum]
MKHFSIRQWVGLRWWLGSPGPCQGLDEGGWERVGLKDWMALDLSGWAKREVGYAGWAVWAGNCEKRVVSSSLLSNPAYSQLALVGGIEKMAGTAPPRGSAAAAASLRRRRTAGGAAAGGASGTMLQFYTDDAPGLKISPNVVLMMSIGFIAFVALLHVVGKLWLVQKN